MSGSIDGSAAVLGNTLYMYDHPWTWFHYCRWFWNFLAGSGSRGRLVQKHLQDPGERNKYPDRIYLDHPAGNSDDICIEPYESRTLYTGNWK